MARIFRWCVTGVIAVPLLGSSVASAQSWSSYELLLAQSGANTVADVIGEEGLPDLSSEQAPEQDSQPQDLAADAQNGPDRAERFISNGEPLPHPFLMGLHIGTLGAGLNAKYNFNSRMSAGLAVDWMRITADADYDNLDDGGAEIRNLSGTVAANYHLGGGGFHLAAGLQIGAPVIEAKATGVYSDASGTTTVIVEGQAEASRTVGPYLGLGFAKSASDQGLSFYGDVGIALMGEMDLAVETSANCTILAGLATDCQQDFEDQMENLGLPYNYPVVRLGLSYRF